MSFLRCAGEISTGSVNDFKINKGRVRGQEGLPKTKSAERFVPMLPPVIAALKELENRPVQNADGYIFITKKGEPMNKHLDRIWARGLKRAGLRHRPSYQLRHTFASLALERGVSPGWVSKNTWAWQHGNYLPLLCSFY